MNTKEVTRVLTIAETVDNFMIVAPPGCSEIPNYHTRLSQGLVECLSPSEKASLADELNVAMAPILEEWRDRYVDAARKELQ